LALVGLISIAAVSSAFRPVDRSAKPFADGPSAVTSRQPRQSESNLNATPAQIIQSQRGTNTASSSNDATSEVAKIQQLTTKNKEAVYYCGAVTKKGTACSRRVKHPGERCWQHVGMPAMSEMTVRDRK
jgi:hypothetical protein